MIYIYLVKINSSWSEIDNNLISFLSPERKEKIKNYQFERDKKSLLMSGLLVRQKIEELAGIPIRKQKYSYYKNKKPFIFSNNELDFNISHSKNYICCGISFNGSIGVDVEKNGIAPLDIMTYIFHNREIDYVMNSHDPNLNFYRIWTRKEAYSKYVGKGLTMDLTSLNSLKYSNKYFLDTLTYDDITISFCTNGTKNIVFKKIEEKQIYDYYDKLNNDY